MHRKTEKLDINGDGRLDIEEQAIFFARIVKEAGAVFNSEHVHFTPELVRSVFTSENVAQAERDMKIKPGDFFPKGVEHLTLKQAEIIAPILNQALRDQAKGR